MYKKIIWLFFWGGSFFATKLEAVRPFVTDDARISDYGQLELEMWPDWGYSSAGHTLGYNLMFGMSFTDFLQLITGSGINQEIQGGDYYMHDWVIQPKLLFWEAKENGFPGFALALGTVIPLKMREVFRRNTGYFANGMLTTRLFKDWLLLHTNFGYVTATEGVAPAYEKVYWGFGIDLGVYWSELRFIAEIFAGDPYEIIGPTLANQTGFRYLYSDHINLDLTYGWQEEVDDTRRPIGRTTWWLQLGIRLLFDLFTKEGKPGNPLGAPGLLRFD
ncbi:MAG: hypothetical protein NZM25_02730 [Leptospiraceae bacterium]|nr:hypothetical protein [Leptospiraceae bacterium]MDW8307184.1 hypothetical protein [Leptospiraceae bacterium]